jgi:hypothetical protein
MSRTEDLAPITHILPLTTIRRERALPVSGKVLVRASQKVGASDTIAEANLYAEYLLIDVARGLGMSAEKADRYIHCQVGSTLADKDVIAGPVGLARRIVRSPREGKVILSGGGQVLLETTGKPLQLKAGMPGEVVELVSDRGAIVEATGALVQGVWGNGQMDFGVMSVLGKTPDYTLQATDLDISLRGSIILAGHCQDPKVLQVAEEVPVRGLILASMSSALVPIVARLHLPVILIEGFGQRKMNSVAFKLLTTNDRREVAVNAETWDLYMGTRPEVFIPLPGTSSVSTPPESGTFAPNRQVRISRAPDAGEIGVILSLKPSAIIPGGLRTPVAEVRLENGTTTLVPLANLEVLI